MTTTTDRPDLDTLRQICREVREDVIEMLCLAGSGHPGGSLSQVELLVSLFWGPLRHDPQRPDWPERDPLILSKGHGCPTLYAVMARRGYFPREELWNLRKTGAMLQGHPVRTSTPGIEACTGALGQGLAVAQGMALAAKIDKSPRHVWAITGDGEIQEGTIWETAMSAGKYRLDNLTAIVDFNGGQIDGAIDEVMPLEPICDKWRAFNWHVIEIADGHDLAQIATACDQALAADDRPTMIVARTVKGKGVSFMEHPNKWHGMTPTREEADRALAEIRAAT